MANADWGGNPNSANQRWSRWTFGVQADVKLPSIAECKENAAKFFRWLMQSSVARAKVTRVGKYYVFVLEIEGPNVHDYTYRMFVRERFITKFMQPGFGVGARLTLFEAGILAGSSEDGTPPDQLLVLPTIALDSHREEAAPRRHG